MQRNSQELRWTQIGILANSATQAQQAIPRFSCHLPFADLDLRIPPNRYFALFRFCETRMHPHSPEFMAGLVVRSLVTGGVCGLFPLCIGLSRKRADLGIGGMLLCIVCGFCGGLLIAAPMALIVATAIYAFTPRPREHSDAEALNYTALDREYREPVEAQLDGASGEQTAAKPKAKKTAGPAIRCSSCGREFWPGLGPTPPWCQGCGADLRRTDVSPQVAPATQEPRVRAPESVTAEPPV